MSSDEILNELRRLHARMQHIEQQYDALRAGLTFHGQKIDRLSGRLDYILEHIEVDFSLGGEIVPFERR